MQLNSEATFQKPSALAVAERRALIDYLSLVAADLAHQLALDGLTVLVPQMLDIKEALGRMADDISSAQPDCFDELIAGVVGRIRKARQRLPDRPAYMTIQ